MGSLQGFVLVFFGAGLGGVLRHTVNLASLRLAGPDLPVGTFLVNVLGSLAIGGVAGYVASRGHGAQALHLFLAAGILGGFTTFSAFSLEAALLWERGRLVACVLYTLVSVVLSIAGVFTGLALARGGHTA
ncbi:MAG TPA: fluoride efflux transporter CrcB [Gemmatimonadales bacterium]|nr:fluoride efflux transporter CrcB [Gemmatimonadales bacterium]